jgi:hypothetical protein
MGTWGSWGARAESFGWSAWHRGVVALQVSMFGISDGSRSTKGQWVREEVGYQFISRSSKFVWL